MKICVLHRDVSPFNSLIEDREDGVQGMLIN